MREKVGEETEIERPKEALGLGAVSAKRGAWKKSGRIQYHRQRQNILANTQGSIQSVSSDTSDGMENNGKYEKRVKEGDGTNKQSKGLSLSFASF